MGTELNEARANMLLGMAHALASDGTLALRYATSASTTSTNTRRRTGSRRSRTLRSRPLQATAGDADLHAEHYAEAARLGEAIADRGRPRGVHAIRLSRWPKP